jgi:glycyl-tRNA synthetase
MVTKVKDMKQIVEFSKLNGFVYQGSDIYGGLANSWDYGPRGSVLKDTIRSLFLQKFVQERPDMVQLDANILMNPQVWVASGHVGGFVEPLMDCKACKTRHRADKIIEDILAKDSNAKKPANWAAEKTPLSDLMDYIKGEKIVCPDCEKFDWTEIRVFNPMFKTFQGVTEDSSAAIYLRPETAQGIFVNFPNIVRSSRKKVPF